MGGAVGGIIGAGAKLIGGLAAKKGADKGAAAAAAAAEQAREDLQPWREAGELGLDASVNALGLDEAGAGNPFDLQSHQLMGQNLLRSNENAYSVENLSEGFQESPGFEFQMQKGLDAMESRGASRGGLLSGNNLVGMNEYAQGVANQDYWNFVNNQFRGKVTDANQRQQQYGNIWNLSEAGRAAATNQGQFALQGAGMQSQALQAGGAALGSAISGAGQTLGSTAVWSGANQPLSQAAPASTGSSFGFTPSGGGDLSGWGDAWI